MGNLSAYLANSGASAAPLNFDKEPFNVLVAVLFDLADIPFVPHSLINLPKGHVSFWQNMNEPLNNRDNFVLYRVL